MIVQSGLLKEILRGACVFERYIGNLFSWEQNEFRVKTGSLLVSSISGILLGSSYFYKLYEKYKAGGEMDVLDFVGGMFGAVQLAVSQFALGIIRNHGPTQDLINSLIKFEKRHGNNGNWEKSPADRRRLMLAKFTCGLLSTTGIRGIASSVGIAVVFVPSLPMNVFSYPPGNWIIVVVDKLSEVTYLPEMVVMGLKGFLAFCVNTTYWHLTARNGSMIAELAVVCSVSLTCCVSIFRSKVKNLRYSWVAGSKRTNNLENDAKLVYRQLQLLTRMFNEIFAWFLMIFLVLLLVGQVVCGFQLIRGDRHESTSNSMSLTEVGLLAVCTLIMVNCVGLTNFLYSFCGELHHTSIACLEEFQYDTVLQQEKRFKKLLKSFPVVKVNFGVTNYIERMTPVMYQQFVVQRLADMLLLT